MNLICEHCGKLFPRTLVTEHFERHDVLDHCGHFAIYDVENGAFYGEVPLCRECRDKVMRIFYSKG